MLTYTVRDCLCNGGDSFIGAESGLVTRSKNGSCVVRRMNGLLLLLLLLLSIPRNNDIPRELISRSDERSCKQHRVGTTSTAAITKPGFARRRLPVGVGLFVVPNNNERLSTSDDDTDDNNNNRRAFKLIMMTSVVFLF